MTLWHGRTQNLCEALRNSYHFSGNTVLLFDKRNTKINPVKNRINIDMPLFYVSDSLLFELYFQHPKIFAKIPLTLTGLI